MAQEADWYMVTLYDKTCHPTADWTINFFTENIEDFQSRWFKLETDEGRKERFLRSKSGTFEMDYYGVKEAELDIVQQYRATIYDEKKFTLSNTYFWIENAIGFRSHLHADAIELQFKWIRFKSKFARVTKVKVSGLTHHLYIIRCCCRRSSDELFNLNRRRGHAPKIFRHSQKSFGHRLIRKGGEKFGSKEKQARRLLAESHCRP